MWKYLKGVPPPKKRKADDEDVSDAIHEWFAAGVRRTGPDTVKPLNQDQAHKLTVMLLEDEEGDIFSDMKDGTSL